jgi:hypothetical protein
MKLRVSSVSLLCSILWFSVTAGGCVSERASQPSAPLGSFAVERVELQADIDVDMDRRLTGEATEETLLWFITLKRPKSYAANVRYSADGSSLSFLDSLFGGAAERMKSAAAYNAVYGKADIIVAPQWVVEVEDYVVFSRTTARVSGYAGTIREIYQDPREQREYRFGPKGMPVKGAAPGDTGQWSAQAARAASSTTEDLTVGTGAVAQPGDIVAFHYRCSLPDGRIVFDSRMRGGVRERVAGAPTTPPGLKDSLVGVRRGGHRRVVLTPDQAYGTEGLDAWTIPANSTVTFDLFIEDVATDAK